MYGREDWLNDFYDAQWRQACRQQSAAPAQHAGLSGSSAWRRADSARAAGGGKPSAVQSDYRFCYLGPAGSSTPVHADVLRSYSWSVNVCGAKVRPPQGHVSHAAWSPVPNTGACVQRWRLLPPQHTHLLYDCFTRELAASFDLPEDQSARFPNLAQAAGLTWDIVQVSLRSMSEGLVPHLCSGSIAQ